MYRIFSLLKYPRSRMKPIFLYPYSMTLSTMKVNWDTSVMDPGYSS